MKRLYWLIATIILLIAGLWIGEYALSPQQEGKSDQTVTIYNWGDYIDPALIKKFEKQTGYHVRYETFDSNEAMYTKLKQGGTHFDIVIPSDYMIQKLKASNLLEPLNHKRIKGMNHIDPTLLNLPFDPHNRYSVPYFFGTLGIVYNENLLPQNVTIEHWGDLWNPALKGNIMLFDGAREVMGIALTRLGYSINSENHQQLNEASALLKGLTPNVKGIVADEMKMYMENNECAVGVTFSGEAAEMMSCNKHLRYIVPEEGSNLWFDNMVIPKGAENKAGAYAFINFMLEPKNAAQNAEYIGYATPNITARKYLPKRTTENTAFYPTKAQMKHLEVYRLLSPYWINVYNEDFLAFKLLQK